MKYAGWVSNPVSLSRHSDSEEAKRLVKLLGGADESSAHAKHALESGDARWAARLATYVLRAEPNHEAAREVQVQALESIAYTTNSANERNYLLTTVAETKGAIDWNRVLSRGSLQRVSSQPSEAILRGLGVRLKAEDAFDAELTVEARIEGEEGVHTVSVRRGVFLYDRVAREKVDARIVLSRSDLDRIAAGVTNLDAELAAGSIEVEAGQPAAERFVKLFE